MFGAMTNQFVRLHSEIAHLGLGAESLDTHHFAGIIEQRQRGILPEVRRTKGTVVVEW